MNSNQQNISPHNFEQCTKCTVCTVYCPVSVVKPDYPGPKQAGPDGERYRLKDAAYYDSALKYCLNCKRCEVACPSGVRIGDLILASRIKYTPECPSLRDTMLAETDIMGHLAGLCAPLVNASLSLDPVKSVMEKTLKIDSHRRFPKYSSRSFVSWFKREAAEAQKQFTRRVAYFHGCYVNYNYPDLGKALVHLLNACGIGIDIMPEERCCGVAKISNRLVKEAMRDAERNLSAMRAAIGERNCEAVLCTGSTCCFTMRDEYPHVLGVDNADIRDRITLATAFIYRMIDRGDIRLVFRPDFAMRVAYHTPCHMERLGMAHYSVGLLSMIPGVDLIVLDSNCCGIAGTYGFKKENYETSQAIGAPLFNQIEALKPDFVATDCETCKWQIEMSTSAKVLHPIEILARAIDVDATAKANLRS